MPDMAESFGRSGGGSSFDAMLQPSQEQLDQTVAGMRRKSDEIYERAGKVADTIEANRAAAGKLEMPEMVPLPEAPTPEMRDPIQAFGSTASLIGILGSMLTRRPLTHALNAAAGTMNAYRQNDLQSAKFQFDTWKANMENVKTLNDWQLERYKTALEGIDKDSKAALSELQAYASAFKDDNMLAVLQSRSIGDIYKLMQSREAADAKLAAITPKIEEFNNKTRLEAELLQAEGPNVTPQRKLDIHTRVWNPSGAAALQNAERKESLTPAQDLAAAGALYESMFPLDALRQTRTRAEKPEGRSWDDWYEGKTPPRDEPIPSRDEFIAKQWPAFREQFMKARGGAVVAPPSGVTPPPASTGAAPAATPEAAATPANTAPSDFIPVPEKFRDPKLNGRTFIDKNGDYGTPGQTWRIQGDKAFPVAAPAAGGQGGPAIYASAKPGESVYDDPASRGAKPRTSSLATPERNLAASAPATFAPRSASDKPTPVPGDFENLVDVAGSIKNDYSAIQQSLAQLKAAHAALGQTMAQNPSFRREQATNAKRNEAMNEIESDASGAYSFANITKKLKELDEMISNFMRGDDELTRRGRHNARPPGMAFRNP